MDKIGNSDCKYKAKTKSKTKRKRRGRNLMYKITKRNNSLEVIKTTLLEFYSQMDKAFSVLRVNI